jgi:hypothetical protein
MPGWTAPPASFGGAELGSTRVERVATARADRCERDTHFLPKLSGAVIVGAMKTN